MGHFQQSTGSSFQGGHDQYDQMAAMASKLTGFPIPASMLRKLCAPALPGSHPAMHCLSKHLCHAEPQPAHGACSSACRHSLAQSLLVVHLHLLGCGVQPGVPCAVC